MHLPARCGSSTASTPFNVIVSRRTCLLGDAMSGRCESFFDVLQMHISPYCSPASRRSKSACSALCLRFQSASMELSKGGSLEPSIDVRFSSPSAINTSLSLSHVGRGPQPGHHWALRHYFPTGFVRLSMYIVSSKNG